MQKTIFLTGATDGIGFETAKALVSMGHNVLVHGRSLKKLGALEETLAQLSGNGTFEGYRADLSKMTEVETLAKAVSAKHSSIDVLINNAGVYNTPDHITQEGLETRFAVNTIAPYLLTRRLLPLFNAKGRVVNLSSAAQFPVDPNALIGREELSDGAAYAQSKLALTMWSRSMALELGEEGPAIIAVNPRSMLGSKMVKEAYGVHGADLGIGADILCRAALSDEFANASGRYFDNDIAQFTSPHPDALNDQKCAAIVAIMDKLLVSLQS